LVDKPITLQQNPPLPVIKLTDNLTRKFLPMKCDRNGVMVGFEWDFLVGCVGVRAGFEGNFLVR
jgi:hypothetical protein